MEPSIAPALALSNKAFRSSPLDNESETGEIDNSDVTLKKLTALLCTSEMSDLQLVVGHRVFNVHKLILCMSSEVLRVMLTNPKWPEFYKDQIILKEEPECVVVFDKFLKYLYSGLVELSPESALPLLMLADKYGVSDMSQLCMDYMCTKYMAAIRKGKIISWLRYAQLCDHRVLETLCFNMIHWNFRMVAQASDFVTMHREDLVSFLRSSDLVIHDEFVLFTAVKKWLLAQKEAQKRPSLSFKKLILEIVTQIRFPLMTLSQLRLLHSDELVQEARELCEERITLGVKYHSLPMHMRDVFESSSMKTDQYAPRNYMSEIWNTSLAVENFLCFSPYGTRLMYFSSPVANSEADENLLWEWQMELYPKGVHYGQFMLIGLQENLVIPETVYKTVRLAIKAETSEKKHVEINLLVTAQDSGVEYVHHVIKQRCIFDAETSVCNIDNIVLFDELNCGSSSYITGEDRNSFKVMIIIKPLDFR